MKNYLKDKHWYVYRYDINSDKIVKYDIFNHGAFCDYVNKHLNEYNKEKDVNMTKESFKEAIRKEIMYYFWAKCEYEIVITNLFEPATVQEKIDVAAQIMINFDIFIDYLLS